MIEPLRNGRRGGILILIVIGIIILSIWTGLDHTGRLLHLTGMQRETMQRLRSSDIPSRTGVQAPCEASRPDAGLPERVR